MLLTALQVHVTNQPNGDRVQEVAAAFTALAALATAWMAWKTRSMARQTAALAFQTKTLATETKAVAVATAKEATAVENQGKHIAIQAAATTDALKAAVLPWLTWEPTYTEEVVEGDMGVETSHAETGPGLMLYPTENGIYGAILVRNVGLGIALLDTFNSWVYGGGAAPIQRYVKLRTSKPVLPSDQIAWLTFEIPAVSAAWSELTMDKFTQRPSGGRWSLEIYYQDVKKVSTYKAVFHAAARNYPFEWAVTTIEYWDGQANGADFTVYLDSRSR